MICARVFIIIGLFVILILPADAQRRDSDKMDRSVLIQLQYGQDFFPRSFFQRIRDEKLTLYTLERQFDGSNEYVRRAVNLADYDYIRIIDRKKTFLNSALCGLIVGTTSFFIVRELSRSRTSRNLQLINQEGASGNVEGAMAGGLGFGVGILLYDSMFNRKLNIVEDKREILRRLKKFRY